MKNLDDEKITKKVKGVFYLIFSKQQSMYWFPKTVFRNTSDVCLGKQQIFEEVPE